MSFAQKLRLGILIVCAFALVPAALAGAPRFTTLDVPGATFTLAFGINPAGDIVGGFYDSSGNEHGFVLSNGNFIPVDYPGAAWTEAEKISPQGDIVGQYGSLDDNTIHGFLLRNGSFYPVDVPGPTDLGRGNTMPFGISPDGTIVGCYHQSNPDGGTIMSTMRGFVLTADGVTFDSLASTMHGGVNPSGDITGHYYDPTLKGFRNSYIISNGVTDWFTFPGSSITRAWDIGPTGDVVGWYQDAATKSFHGFLRHYGELTSIDVDLAGVKLTRAYGINAVGEIVGYFQDASKVLHGFLLSRRGPE
jgi:probable HAF family extracellular repeat protein